MVKGIERVERGYGMWLRSFLCVYMTVCGLWCVAVGMKREGIKKSDGRKRKRESRRGEGKGRGKGKENEDVTKMRQRRNKDETRFTSFSSICP